MAGFYWHKNPDWLAKVFPGFLWHGPRNEKVIYLTFDDGPIPDMTEWVLGLLSKYNAKATFFMVAHNIEKHPEIFHQVREAGHLVANHTFNHLDAWRNSTEAYAENVNRASMTMIKFGATENEAKLFRPPYGKLNYKSSKWLKREGYKPIMWDVLSADFDKDLNPEDCLKKTLNASQNGSIVVFHDNIKAWKNLDFVLPRFLEVMQANGFIFRTLAELV